MVASTQPCLCGSAVRKDVRVKRIYTGSMRITNQVFENAYENSNSTEFKALAKQVVAQVRLLHSHRLQNTNTHTHTCILSLWSVLFLFSQLASFCCAFQLKTIYSKSPQLAKTYIGSTVQAFR